MNNKVRYATNDGYVDDLGKSNPNNPKLNTAGCLSAIARAVLSTQYQSCNKARDGEEFGR